MSIAILFLSLKVTNYSLNQNWRIGHIAAKFPGFTGSSSGSLGLVAVEVEGFHSRGFQKI